MLMGLMVQTAEYGGGDQRELERLLAGIAGGEHEDLAQLYHRITQADPAAQVLADFGLVTQA